MEGESQAPHVLIFPLPFQGHINSMLKLAELLSLAGVAVTFLNTPHSHNQLTTHSDVLSRFARFPSFRFRTISDGLPPNHPRTFDHITQIITSWEIVTKPIFRDSLISARFGSNLTCVILDGFFKFLVDAHDSQIKIPVLGFRTVSACSVWAYLSIPSLIHDGQLPIRGEEDMDRMLTNIRGMENLLRCRDLPGFCRVTDTNDFVLQFIVEQTQRSNEFHSLILNSFEDLEGPILSNIRTLCPNLYAIGPIHALLKTKLCIKTESLNNEKTESLNKKKTEYLDNEKTESLNNEKTESLNKKKTEYLNDEKTESLNKEKTGSLNNEKTESLNNVKIESLNNEKTEYLNNEKTETLNNEKTESLNNLREVDRSCLTWLDNQPPGSVIYVSFGSITVMGNEKLMEFWHGLVNSGRNFLWVLRPDLVAGKNGSEAAVEIPAEVAEGTRKRGFMVGWAPQEEVLSHEAIGGFLTHSGWNSTLESVFSGKPMICWSYIADQQVNSRFVSDVWKLGLDMKDLCDREIVEKMVNEVMVDRKEEFMRSAVEMGDLARRSVSEGGSSFADFDRLVEDIRLLAKS